MPRLQVKELAEARGFTTVAALHQEALRRSPESRVAYRTVADLWNNKTRRPDIDTLAAVARALGVSIGALFLNGEHDEEIVMPELAEPFTSQPVQAAA